MSSTRLRYAGILGGLGLLVLAVRLIGVAWETPFRDDWAYYLTVKSVLVTGNYSLSPWATANPIAQIYWGALFGHILGLSYGSMRASTLVLAAVAVVAMYGLAIEQGLGVWGASIASMGLAGSGAVLILAFSFMTDVPFLALLLVGLWLMSRALRRSSRTSAILGSLGFGTAILIRPQGAVVVLALAITWISDPRRRQRTDLYSIGLAVCSAATVFQLYSATFHPSWFEIASARAEGPYLYGGSALSSLTWRPAVVAAYACAFSLPLGLCAAPTMLRDMITTRSNRAFLAIAVGLTLAGVVAVRYFTSQLRAPYAGPTLAAADWLVGAIGGDPQVIPGPGVIDTCLACLLIAAEIKRYRDFGTRRRTALSQTLLDHTTILFVLVIIAIPGLLDEYILPCLPLALVIFGREVERSNVLLRALCMVFVVALTVVYSSIIRSGLSFSAAEYAAGNFAVSHGVPSALVDSGDDWEWYGAENFAAFAARNAPGVLANAFFGTAIPGATGEFTSHPANWIAKIQVAPPRPGETLMGRWSYEKVTGTIGQVYLVHR